MLYAQAKLPRSGLANQLFVWARAAKFCMENNAILLKPCFSQLTLGPWLRGQKDKRTYLGLFKTDPEREVAGFKNLCVRAFAQQMGFEAWRKTQGGPVSARRRIVAFQREGEKFTEINGWSAPLADWLVRIARPEQIRLAESVGEVAVGVHVRFGDLGGAQRHPIGWYVAALRFVRSVAGQVPATLFSDGSEAELAELLALPGVTWARGGSALSDLLALSRSRFVIGSGCSSFTAWAVFLGGMPAMTRVGNPLSWFDLRNMEGRFIGEWNPDRPDDGLIRELEALAGVAAP